MCMYYLYTPWKLTAKVCSRLPSPGNADPRWKEKHHLLTKVFSGASTLTLRELLAPRCLKGFNMQYMFIQQTVKTSWESTMNVCQLSNGGRMLDIFQPSAFILIQDIRCTTSCPPWFTPFFCSPPNSQQKKQNITIPTTGSAVSGPSSHRSENKMHPRSHQTSPKPCGRVVGILQMQLVDVDVLRDVPGWKWSDQWESFDRST